MADFPEAPSLHQDGGTKTVSSTNPGSINDLIQAVAPFSKVLVPAGRYTEALFLDKEILIEGESDGVIFTPAPGHDCITIRSPLAVIRNVRFDLSNAQGSTVINLLSGIAVIERS
jgi:polygalacturonase